MKERLMEEIVVFAIFFHIPWVINFFIFRICFDGGSWVNVGSWVDVWLCSGFSHSIELKDHAWQCYMKD